MNEPIVDSELMKQCVRKIMDSYQINMSFADPPRYPSDKKAFEKDIYEAVRIYSNHRVILVFKAALESMDLLNKK